MGIPGFTAETTLGRSSEYFYNSTPADSASGLILALLAVGTPTCQTSGCLTVGSCRTKAVCRRGGIFGTCWCNTAPC